MIEPVRDPVATRDEAMSVAVLAGRRAARELHTGSRVDFDASVARLADSPDYTRDALVTIVSALLSALAVRRRIAGLDMIAVLKTRE